MSENSAGPPMKVIHVITRLLRAGSEENTLATCLYQLDHGFDVSVVHGDEFDPAYYKSLPPSLKLVKLEDMVHPIRPWRDVKAVLALRRLYRSERPDVIHTHQSKAGIIGRLAAWGLPGLGVVHTVHIAPFLNVSGATRLFYIVAERACAAITDVMISVSHGDLPPS